MGCRGRGGDSPLAGDAKEDEGEGRVMTQEGQQAWHKIFAISSSATLYIALFGALVENLSRWFPFYAAVLLSIFVPIGWTMYAYRGMTTAATSERIA